MKTKEVIKNALRENLQNLSKEELINIVADLLVGHIAGRMLAEAASVLTSSFPSQPIKDFGEIINATVSKIKELDLSNHQVCKVDGCLFSEKE